MPCCWRASTCSHGPLAMIGLYVGTQLQTNFEQLCVTVLDAASSKNYSIFIDADLIFTKYCRATPTKAASSKLDTVTMLRIHIKLRTCIMRSQASLHLPQPLSYLWQDQHMDSAQVRHHSTDPLACLLRCLYVPCKSNLIPTISHWPRLSFGSGPCPDHWAPRLPVHW